ncbi:hypothetical protein CCM_06178 [Cordyceps militaris CM01]|uniref:Uncharacterized protein n=1 Tax=Cordyceps militaris (strain CM01) TaxID=983644 RepID=G3JJ76_CORMM|nr:uncharacterized protein CCM_06178 [Cordyceps militaris CM01]EGX92018.1 hypothetical protein CCM_06178 [Cordyceps militaris CM01]
MGSYTACDRSPAGQAKRSQGNRWAPAAKLRRPWAKRRRAIGWVVGARGVCNDLNLSGWARDEQRVGWLVMAWREVCAMSWERAEFSPLIRGRFAGLSPARCSVGAGFGGSGYSWDLFNSRKPLLCRM